MSIHLCPSSECAASGHRLAPTWAIQSSWRPMDDPFKSDYQGRHRA